MNTQQEFNRLNHRHAGTLLLAGMALIGWHNWRLWQQDKAKLAKKTVPSRLPPLETWADLPLVSVLVAAFHEADHISAHIESFLALRYPNKELVLCAGGSDGTYELAQVACSNDFSRFPPPRRTTEVVTTTSEVKVIEQRAGEGKQRALCRALPHTKGDIIFLTDADCLLDDLSFEQTIYPIANGQEQVCTGTSRPSHEQWYHPFVAIQASSQLYAALHAPPYADGLLGRNCAVSRTILQQSKGLEAVAPTGTDYVLAKMLAQSGARIRQLPNSRIVTDYPTTISGYMCQQRRWLRNVVLHGHRFGALDEVKASLQTSLTGLGMLLMPLISLFVPLIIVLWLLLIWHAWLSRLRYLSVVSTVLNRPRTGLQIVLQAGMIFVDFLAWSQALLDYVLPQRQKKW